VLDIYHYNEKSQDYKSFKIQPIEGKESVFMSMTRGNKPKSERDRITLALSKQELAYLIMEAKNIYYSL